MLRSGAPRSVLRSFNTAIHSPFKATAAPIRQQLRSQLCTATRHTRPSAIARPLAPKVLLGVRGQSSGSRGPVDTIDKKREEGIQAKKLEATPDKVSMESTVMPLTGTSGEDSAAAAKTEADEPAMMAGIYSDLEVIRQTFSLKDVPTQAYYMGLAGVLPYMATSLSTVYCAWEINHAAETGSSLFLSEQIAEHFLHIIEPIQVGYGAVILSFLGAIHWGLEFAEYNGTKGYSRYAIGVLSTAVAWPTIFMPVEYALITQFLAFNFLYYTDVRAKTRGWTPQWYGIYRFTLTFIVGASIILSLVGRGQIADRIGRSQHSHTISFGQYHPDQDEQADAAEVRRKYLGEEEDEDDEDEEEDEEGGDDE